jgi:hypothetical protein
MVQPSFGGIAAVVLSSLGALEKLKVKVSLEENPSHQTVSRAEDFLSDT